MIFNQINVTADKDLTNIKAGHLTLKVGTLEVDLDPAGCHGTVRIDGQPLYVRKLTIEMEVGQLAKVVAEVVPISLHKTTNVLGDTYAKSGA